MEEKNALLCLPRDPALVQFKLKNSPLFMLELPRDPAADICQGRGVLFSMAGANSASPACHVQASVDLDLPPPGGPGRQLKWGEVGGRPGW